MVALCIPVAPLVMAPSRRVVYQAGAPRNALRHHNLKVRRRQVVKARQPSMIFGLQRMFNWLTPTDIGAAVICTGSSSSVSGTSSNLEATPHLSRRACL